MGIKSKVTVAGAAGLFGLVIAAGGAIAASGATLVADAPGTSLRVEGIGAAPATEISKTARLKLLALSERDGTVETVFPAAAVTLSTAPVDSAAAHDVTHVPGTGNDGIAGNGNTNNGKGNDGISGNGNTDNGHGNQGIRGNSENRGEPGEDKLGRGNQEAKPGLENQTLGDQNASDLGQTNGNPGQPGPGLDNPNKGPKN